MYVMLPLVGNFESQHYGLTNAEGKETSVISTEITASLASIPSKITTAGDLREDDASKTKTVENFKTEAVGLMQQIPTVQTSTLEIANTSSGDSRPLRVARWLSFSEVRVPSTSTHIFPSPTLTATFSIMASPRHDNSINHPTEPSRAASSSQYLLSTASLPLNTTKNSHGVDGDVKDDCSTEACDTYVTRWVDFYLNVGGWILLAVILVGIAVLVITHVLGRKRRKEIKMLPQLMYREMFYRPRGRWV